MRQYAALLVGLALSLSCLLGTASAAEFQPPATLSVEDASRQLLVMLRLPKAHYRPDSSYAGAYGDGVGQQARKLTADMLARKHGLSLASEWPMPLAGVDCYVMRFADSDLRAPTEVARAMERETSVAWAQAMHVYHAQATHQDPLYAAQPAAQQWRLADLHQIATGHGVRIAVIDSGIEAIHPDLAGQLESNENFVDGLALAGESHGTAVAGIVAAHADNGLGIAGVAPQARLLGMRACWEAPAAQTLCTSLSLAKALHAAILQGAQIINMSLSGPDDRLLGLLLDQALARGAAVVAALGSGVNTFPASHPGVFAVRAVSSGPSGTVLAPGKDVPSTAPGGGFALVSGSSFAAAHVTGLLALTMELAGSKAGLQRAALVIDSVGRIDAWASLSRRRGAGLAGVVHTPP